MSVERYVQAFADSRFQLGAGIAASLLLTCQLACEQADKHQSAQLVAPSPSASSGADPRADAPQPEPLASASGALPEPALSGSSASDLPGKKCTIAITAVLSADVYRGYPDTVSEAFKKKFESESHFNFYLACTYLVRIGTAEYSYKHVAGSGPGERWSKPELCSQKSAMAEAVANILHSSDDCRNLSHAGLQVRP